MLGLIAACFVPMGPIGFGFSLTVLASFGIYCLLHRVSLVRPQTKANYLWIGVILFASLLAWRDAPALKFLNFLTMALFGGVLAIRARPSIISKGSVFDYPFRAIGAWFVAFADGFNLLLTDIAWRLIPQGAQGKALTSIVRGLLLATPLMLAFGALFANADARFEKMLGRMFSFNAEAIVEQTFIGFSIAWFAAGLLRRIYIGQVEAPQPAPPVVATEPAKPSSKLGFLEVLIVLGSLNVLFMLFVGTQWPYFFGGTQTLRETSGLSVAEYARRGFFELVAASALALPTLLGLHALIDPESPRMRRLFKVLSLLLVALLLVVMLSAAIKMRLYMETYSLSTLRIYVAASLAWLGLVFAWFSLTTLRERANRFAWGGLIAFAAIVLGLNTLSPDAVVARWNITNKGGKAIDWEYLSRLSADATPEISKNWQKVPGELQPSMAKNLLANSLTTDWRSSSLSTFAAGRSLGSQRAEIEKRAKEFVEPERSSWD